MRPYENFTVRELRDGYSTLSKDLRTTDKKYKETLKGMIKEVSDELEYKRGFKMTTYKLTVPIKCKTIHKAWKTVKKGIVYLVGLCGLALVGVLNGCIFYSVCNSIDATMFILSVAIVAIDFIVLDIILDECNIDFKIGCIKEGGRNETFNTRDHNPKNSKRKTSRSQERSRI